MTTTNGGQSQGVQAKVMEAVSAFAQANERVVGELIDLSSTAARDGLRAIGELQMAAMETARGFQMPGMPQPETLEDLRRRICGAIRSCGTGRVSRRWSIRPSARRSWPKNSYTR